LLAEVLEDEGEEPVAVEDVAYTNDVIVWYLKWQSLPQSSFGFLAKFPY